MAVWLKTADYVALVHHARGLFPKVACGLLGGKIDQGEKKVLGIWYINNKDASGAHFAIDIKEQFAAVKEMRDRGWQQLGNWHSHPLQSAIPSDKDKEQAFDANASYFILSLAGGEPVLCSYQVAPDKTVTKEDLCIVPDF